MTLHRFGTVERGGAPVAVLEVDGQLHDLPALADAHVTVLGMLREWATWAPRLEDLAGAIAGGSAGVPLGGEPRWLAPVLHPPKVVGIGANYKDHLDHAGIPHPTTPYLFLKPATTTLLGSGRTMVIPRESVWADWEAELAVVIGRRARRLRPEEALGAVAGYAPANDASARDWLADAIPPLGSDWLLHKGWDGFTPMGPLITPAAYVDDPQDVTIRLTLDGEVKQDGTTANQVFGVADLVAHASSIMTLEPGDVLLTGTPMGAGFAVDPREHLTDGQTMVVEVGGLGAPLVTPVAKEAA